MGLGILAAGFLEIGRTDGAEKSLPMRGEGAAIENRYYSCGVRHSYDGVQRTARPTKFGSRVMGSSDRSM